MSSYTIYGAQNIQNKWRKNKMVRLAERSEIFVITLLSLCFSVCSYFPTLAKADPLPVRIAWRLPLKSDISYLLQIAADSGFAEVLLDTVATGGGYAWQAPGEGVYHWRLMRAPREPGAEGNTFVSGSFAVLAPVMADQEPYKLKWEPQGDADRYKLFVLEDGRRRTMVTQATEIIVPKINSSLMIEVVGYTGGRRTSRNFHLDSSLTLSGGPAPALTQIPTPSEPSVGPPVPAEADRGAPFAAGPMEETDAEEPAGEQLSEPPEEEAPLEVEEAPVVVGEAPAQESAPSGGKRVHLVGLHGLYFEEHLRAQKLEVDLNSSENLPGVAAEVWSQPTAGLQVRAKGSYHEFKAKVSQEGVFSSQDFNVDQTRFTLLFNVGWDLLSSASSHLLSISAGGAMVRLPLLPLKYEGSPNSIPRLVGENLTLFGGGGAYGFFSRILGVVVDGGYYRDLDDEARMVEGAFRLEFYPSPPFFVAGGLFLRSTEVERCHKDAATCLREGRVLTKSMESGLLVGGGVAFF